MGQVYEFEDDIGELVLEISKRTVINNYGVYENENMYVVTVEKNAEHPDVEDYHFTLSQKEVRRLRDILHEILLNELLGVN